MVKAYRAIGLMSGTSMDGVDVAALEPDGVEPDGATCGGGDQLPCDGIYVARNGDDAAPGTRGLPVKTIAAGVAKAKATSKTSVFVKAGIPITELLSKERIEAIAKRTADGGAEITKLVGTSAWYAPGQAAAEMCEAILKDKKKILPCSVYLQGEYGIRGLFVGVPVKLGARGVEQIVEITLTPEEDAALKKSAGSVKELVDVIQM